MPKVSLLLLFLLGGFDDALEFSSFASFLKMGMFGFLIMLKDFVSRLLFYDFEFDL